MIKKILSRFGVMVFAGATMLFATQCGKDKGDGDGCFNTVFQGIDSANIPDYAALGDSVTVIVYGTTPNFCYSDFVVHVSKGSKSLFCNADIQFNSCQTCATSVKPIADTFKFKADAVGTWKFQFRNDKGDAFDSMIVN